MRMKKMTIKRAAAILILHFTPTQVRRIEKAAKICGWKAAVV
jgi:hypothetical protein